MSVLKLEHVKKDFTLRNGLKTTTIHAVKDASFELASDKTIALVGESGSGKSTIARMITCLETPTSGSITLDGKPVPTHGKDLYEYRHNVQMVFQDPFASLNPYHTIFHHILRPLMINHMANSQEEYEQKVIELLERVELTPAVKFMYRRPHELSGGQRQRVGHVGQEGLEVLLLHPRIGEDLLHVAAEGEILLDVALEVEIELLDRAVEGGDDWSGLEVLVAVHAGDLFHDVGLDGHVARGAPRRNDDVHIVAAEGDLVTQREEHFLNLGVLQTFAETAGQPVEVNVDLGALELLGIVVDEARDLHLGIEVAEELHRQVKRLVAALGVDGLFVAGGRLGAVVVPQGGAADAGGLEVGDLQNDLAGGGEDGVLGAAHDARQTHHTGVVGDGQVVAGHRQLLAVEQQQLLAARGCLRGQAAEAGAVDLHAELFRQRIVC